MVRNTFFRTSDFNGGNIKLGGKFANRYRSSSIVTEKDFINIVGGIYY